MKILAVVNLCPHYRIKLFETLDRMFDIKFLFFSKKEKYYDGKIHTGNFNGEYLWGFNITRRLRINPKLIYELVFYNYDVLIKCINSPLIVLFSFIISKIRRKKFILWTGIWQHPQTLFHKFSFPFIKLIYKRCDAIGVYGTHIKKYLISLGINEAKIFVFQKAADNCLYNKPVAKQQLEDLAGNLNVKNKNVVLFIGQLIKEKGVDYLIKAFAKSGLKDTVLMLIGRGPQRNYLKNLAEGYGLNGRIMFLDYVENRMLGTYYALADVFVMPSVTTKTFKEPWGMVVNEAMNQGCPVIATDAVGAAAGGMVENGVNGFIVPQRSDNALKEALETILGDKTLRDKMAANSRRIVSQYTVGKKAACFKDAVDYVLK